MRILIDIVHLGDLNFYKKTIDELKEKHEIILTVINRGKLQSIAAKEHPDIEILRIGKHRKTFLGKLIGIVDREIKLILILSRKHFDRVTSFGFYPAIAAKFFGVRSVLFHDDYEYKLIFKLCRIFGDEMIIPDSISESGKNIKKYPGFKELAYLYNFKPSRKVLQEYGLKENKYIFVRDISPISLNYKDSKVINYSEVFKKLRKGGFKIFYYPEDAAKAKQYHNLARILSPPVTDLHSLIYFAALTISSGDGIAKESAIIGTPVVYTGGRKMAILKPLIKMGAVTEAKSEKDTEILIKKIIDKNLKHMLRNLIKDKMGKDWPDWSKMIIKELTNEADQN